jgi:predicted cupin superfamily sugar epimerase
MSQPQNASYWINKLQLKPHPEGGYYHEVFRSAVNISRVGQDARKQACTSIYYLLEGGDYSGFHRLQSDEVWYFHKGAPLHIHAINKDGIYTLHELADNLTGNLSVVIPAGVWFAAELATRDGFTLVSCAVAPAFDFNEFEMAFRENLSLLCPNHREIIDRLCRY